MKITTDMKMSKTTPGTVVYATEAAFERMETPLIKTLYLTKQRLPTPYPERILVTVEARSDGGA